MNYKNEIEIMRKTFMCEIEIDTEEYINAINFLLEKADLTIIKPLMELFYDDCYELSLMHNLDDFVLMIASKYGKDGFIEVIESLKYVKESGEYFGKEALVKMMMWGDNEYSALLSILSDISANGRENLISTLLKIKEDNIESLKEKVEKLLSILI